MRSGRECFPGWKRG